MIEDDGGTFELFVQYTRKAKWVDVPCQTANDLKRNCKLKGFLRDASAGGCNSKVGNYKTGHS